MSKFTLFTNKNCPFCGPVVEKMKEEEIDFKLVEITNSIAELKEFLKHRDSDPYFEAIKARGSVGVPTLMDNEGNFYDATNITDFKNLK